MEWHGTIAGVVTPLHPDGAIDWDSFERHLESFRGAGLAGVVVNADTGEGALLTRAEREEVLRFSVAAIGADVPVLAGLLPGHTPHVADEARAAGALGAAAFQVFTPPVFMGAPLAAEPVEAYLRAITAVTDVPLIVYQAPAGLGVTFPLDVLRRLVELPGVQAIKESSWSRELAAESARAFGDDRHPVVLLSGQDTFVLDSLRGGADAAMLAVAAVDPALWVQLVNDPASEAAASLQQALDPLVAAVFAPPLRDFRARLKALLAADGTIASAAVRAPLTPVGADETELLVAHRAAALAHAS